MHSFTLALTGRQNGTYGNALMSAYSICLLNIEIKSEIANISVIINIRKNIFKAFFIYPRKIYNKYTINIFKIRQSMQKKKKSKKVLDKIRVKW